MRELSSPFLPSHHQKKLAVPPEDYLWSLVCFNPSFFPGEFHGQKSLAGCNPWGLRVGHNWVTNTFTLVKYKCWVHPCLIFFLKYATWPGVIAEKSWSLVICLPSQITPPQALLIVRLSSEDQPHSILPHPQLPPWPYVLRSPFRLTRFFLCWEKIATELHLEGFTSILSASCSASIIA